MIATSVITWNSVAQAPATSGGVTELLHREEPLRAVRSSLPLDTNWTKTARIESGAERVRTRLPDECSFSLVVPKRNRKELEHPRRPSPSPGSIRPRVLSNSCPAVRSSLLSSLFPTAQHSRDAHQRAPPPRRASSARRSGRVENPCRSRSCRDRWADATAGPIRFRSVPRARSRAG